MNLDSTLAVTNTCPKDGVPLCCFEAARPTAHSLAYLRIGDCVTAVAARLTTGVGGLAPHRAGLAPTGRHTRFHDLLLNPP